MTINNDYFIIYKGKILPKNINILEFTNGNINPLSPLNPLNSNKYNNIEIIARQRGGSGLIDLFTCIIQIGQFFFKILKLIQWFGEFVVWFFQFLAWFFTDFLNVKNLSNEFYNGLMVILVAILRLPFDLESTHTNKLLSGPKLFIKLEPNCLAK